MCDITPEGHVTIRPADGTSVAVWAATRGTDTIDPHSLELIDANIGSIRVPKP